MAATVETSTTFSSSGAVTIPGEVALEILALLDAYAQVAAEFRLDGEADAFYVIQSPTWERLHDALGHAAHEDLDGPLWDAMNTRSTELQAALRNHFDGPALAALAATKMAGDIAELKARLEAVYA